MPRYVAIVLLQPFLLGYSISMVQVLIEASLFVVLYHQFLSPRIGNHEQSSAVVQMLFVPLHTHVVHVLAEPEVLLVLFHV